MVRTPSMAVSTLAGALAGVFATVVVLILLGAPVAIAVGEGLFAGLTVTLSLWGLPRLNALLGRETASVGLAAVGGGIAGGIAAVAMLPPLFLTDLAFGVRFALGMLTVTVGLAGFVSAAALIVVRLSFADSEVRIDRQSSTADTGLVEAFRTRSGEFYVTTGGVLALAGLAVHLLGASVIGPYWSGTVYGLVALGGGLMLGYGAAKLDLARSSEESSPAE